MATEFILLPYSGQHDRTLLHVLLSELKSGHWSSFRAAVAFVKSSGNYPDLLEAIRAFAHEGNTVQLTFGADILSGDNRGSDYAAVQAILEVLKDEVSAQVHLYHERTKTSRRTFHPKVWLFANEQSEKALAIVGSSNWSRGGLVDNVEANVVLALDLSNGGDKAAYNELAFAFSNYWAEVKK